MKCEICGKSPPNDRVTLWRINEKGVKGIWRCEEHLNADQSSKRDPELVRLDKIISGKDVI